MDEILALLQQGKGQRSDFFAEWTSANKLAESLMALANASGGTVLVGVDPKTGNVQGLKDAEAEISGLAGGPKRGYARRGPA